MGKLLKSVRNRRISPFRRDFSICEWQSAKPPADGPAEDLIIWSMGLIFHLKLNGFWQQYRKFDPKSWHPKSFRRIAIGLVNRNLREASATAQRKVLEAAKADGHISPKHLTMKIGGALSGLEYALDDLLAVSVDGLLKPLKDSYSGESMSVKDVTLKDVAMSSILGQLHSNIQHLWEECAWNGWFAVSHEDKMIFECPDEELGELIAVGFTRQMALFSEMSMRGHVMWSQMSDYARQQMLQASPQLAFSGSGRRTKISISKAAETSPCLPRGYATRLWAHEPYMIEALQGGMPNFPTLSPMLLLSAWELLASLAERQIESMPLAEHIVETRQLKPYAPLVPKAELVKIFTEALGVHRSVSEQILHFFQFDSVHSIDFWQQPLVEIDSDTVCPVLPAIQGPNTLFMVEGWMRRGGVNLQDRGTDFEKYERDVLTRSIADSKLANHAQVLPHAYKLNPEGDIDLILRLGNTILALELKCNLYPTRADQFCHHFEDLAKGASQITRKANKIISNLGEFSQKTGWTFSNLNSVKVVPIVLTNLTLGSGMTIENVVITDRWIFELYFSEGSMIRNALFDLHKGTSKSQKEIFYEDPGQAEQNIETYLRNPPQLRHFKEALSSSIYPIPAMDSGDLAWISLTHEVNFEKVKPMNQEGSDQ